jgi:N6-adenosine-specific RNA methylase IME4
MKYQCIVIDPPWSFSDGLKQSEVRRGASSNYNTMTIDNLCSLPVRELADPDGCILALWCVGSQMQEALTVMKSWGFEQKQTYVWVKTKKEPLEQVADIVSDAIVAFDKLTSFERPAIKSLKKTIGNKVLSYKDKLTDMLGFGMGHLFRQTHELCLIGINNTGIYKRVENKSQRSVCFATNEGHSIKPEVFQDSLEALFGDQEVNKCELFGRRKREGWDVVGNQCPGSIGVDIVESIGMLVAK